MRHNTGRLALGLAAIALCGTAGADPSPDPDATVVVTATRTKTPLEQVASSVTVITARQLQATHRPFVLDALREVPGVYVSQTGGRGGVSTVALRGGAAGDTLVLIDGVPVNDPSSPDRAYDFSTLTVDNISRIEILRGPQSTLYGSDAMAGVINIITARGSGSPKARLTLDGGRYKTADGVIGSGGSVQKFSYSATASRYSTAGFPFAALQPGDTHNDGDRDSTFSARADGQLSRAFSLDFTGRYQKGDADSADFPVDKAVDDGIHRAATEQKTGRVEGHWQPLGAKWDVLAGLSANTLNRDYFDQVTGQDSSQSNYNGRTSRADIQADYAASPTNLVTFGAERLRDRSQFSSAFESLGERHIFSTGLYAQDQITLTPRWFATAGVRSDNHETFGSRTTYRATSSYQLAGAGTRLRATYGTGFKAPTLYELYDPFIGNDKLRAESSESYDVGLEQSFLQDRGAFSATYFHNDYHNLIDYTQNGTPNGQYENVSTAGAHGVELIASYRAASQLRLSLNYTYTKTHGADGKPLARRPASVYGATLNYQAAPRLGFNLDGVYVGDRLDPGPYPKVVNLPSYTVFNLAGDYKLAPDYSAFLRVDNLFDKHYEEVYSYRSASRGLYGGLTFSF